MSRQYRYGYCELCPSCSYFNFEQDKGYCVGLGVPEARRHLAQSEQPW